jgi:DNA-binding CsgD family transcriptional regulator
MEDIVAHRVAALTDNQRRMLRLASGGATVAEIAIRLDLPARVVGRELSALLTALGVNDTQQARLLWWGSRAGANPDMIDAAQDLMS